MDCSLHRRPPPPLVPPRQPSHSHPHPSFSANLLDAIYRSLDGAMTPESQRAANRYSKQPSTHDHHNIIHTDPIPQKKKSHSDFWWASAKRKPAPPSYTSSETSSYGFSSDAEPPRIKPTKPNRVQFHNPPALPPRTPPPEKKKKSNPFRKRWKELRKGHSCTNNTGTVGASTRTGSPLSNFLKAIFSSSKTQKKKKNIMGTAAPQLGGVSVPVLVPAPPPEEMDIDTEAEAVKRRVDEILRGLEKDKEEREEDNDSDGSSDLFELENLTEISADELPVYCTTSLVANHPAVCCK